MGLNKKNWFFNGNEQKYLQRIIKLGIKSKKNNFNGKLEKAWSKFHNRKFSITVNSCTSALHTSFLAIGLKKGDEVLVPVLTPIMCGTTIHLAGGVPVYVDVSSKDFLIDINDVKKKITKKTKAILAVHMYSGICNLKELKTFAKKNKIFLIEDCAESFGAYDQNKNLTGSVGDIACWSFQSAKQLTCGDGGILSTNNSILAKKIRKWSNLGFKALTPKGSNINITKDIRQNPNYSRFDKIGYNYRLNEFSAAVALAQLENYKKIIKLRRQMGNAFEQILENNKNFEVQYIHKNSYSSYYTFAAYLKNKNKVNWKDFRKTFIRFGGDGIYAASKLIHQEKAMKDNFIGRCFSSCKKGCISSCEGTPNAKKLQKRLFLFTTNQKNKKEIKRQTNALENTLNYFSLK